MKFKSFLKMLTKGLKKGNAIIIGFSFLGLATLIAFLAFTFLKPENPCTQKSSIASCYDLQENECTFIWTDAVHACELIVENNLVPNIDKISSFKKLCTQSRFDRALETLRYYPEMCKKIYSELDQFRSLDSRF